MKLKISNYYQIFHTNPFPFLGGGEVLFNSTKYSSELDAERAILESGDFTKHFFVRKFYKLIEDVPQ